MVGITWPVPPELDDAALERKLFTPPFASMEALRPQPDWPRIHGELRRPGVTLLLLWEEYRAGQPDGYGYKPVLRPVFCLARPPVAHDAPFAPTEAPLDTDLITV